MPTHTVPYARTGRFQPIVLDLLDGGPSLAAMQHWPGGPRDLEAAAQARTFDPASRAILVGALERQYEGVEVHEAVRANLAELRRPRTLTVTTGHQLCLFTGPLYVPLKILNVVRVARQLSTNTRPVVPIFWMATEDHDRPEIDHAWVAGQRVSWPGEVAGAVGRLPLAGIEGVLDQVDPLLGQGSHADELRGLLRDCYRPDRDLADATRRFVSALFGRFGVVVLDGDDPALKRLFAPLVREELLNQVTERTVRHANERLGERYAGQAHARPINLFHLRKGHRARIEPVDGRYHVLDGGPSFDPDALLREVEDHPEAFSPNVLLRPLYQETILPNVAYVGGGGELAYWLQLRWLFDAFRTPMPVLLLRGSAALLTAKDLQRVQRLGLGAEDLFRPAHELEARVAATNASFDTSLETERHALFAVFEALAMRMRNADPTLEQAARATSERTLHGLDALERKLLRRAKREQHELLADLARVEQRMFPGGGLQERRENFMPWYATQGPAFFDRLLAEVDPLRPGFSLIFED